MKCFSCQVETKNPKFCSRSCATIVNNTLSPKREKIMRVCKYCCDSTKILSYRRIICDACTTARDPVNRSTPQQLEYTKLTKSQKVKIWQENHKKQCINKCGNIVTYKRTKCKPCTGADKTAYYKNLTIEEYRTKNNVVDKHPSWANVAVRNFCRSWNRDLCLLPCYVCGYIKHVELAHIKAVSTYPLTTTVGEINDPSNVVQLCPNCHWEFDNGILNIKF